MAARTLPNLGLKAFFSFGEDGWNADLDLNFLKLSVLTQGGAIDFIASKPVSPAEGSVYVLNAFASNNANAVAVYDNGAWVHFAPKAGWTIYNRADDSYLVWNGTSWQITSLPKLRALGDMSSSIGLVEQTGANTFSKRRVGVDFGSDIISRDGGDTRYALVGHTHPATGVSSFNTRTGAVSLNSNDIQGALGFLPAASDPLLTGLSALGTTTGLIEQTGATTFAKHAIGVSSPSDIPSLALADQRYQGLSATLSGLAVVSSGDLGVVEQVGNRIFRIRPVGIANSTDLLTRGAADGIYLSAGNFSASQLNDFPDSYVGQAQHTAVVNSEETGLIFKAPGEVSVKDVAGDYTLLLSDAGSHLRVSDPSQATVTVPKHTSVAFPVGTTLSILQAGQGAVTIQGVVGVTIDYKLARSNYTDGIHSVVHLIQYEVDSWTLYGDLA